jgi:hydrogenase expression/formation protein HypC
MCLGDLGQVLETGAGRTAVVRTAVRTVTVSLLVLDEPVAPGDWLVCHSGFALSRVGPEEAAEAAAIRAGGRTHTTTTEVRP